MAYRCAKNAFSNPSIANTLRTETMADWFSTSYPRVNRVEVIDASGRVFVGYFEPGAFGVVQDEERTLKIFVGEPVEPTVAQAPVMKRSSNED
jgi:hypothetical protein